MSESPADRAKRMARFSSKVQDEEEDGVAVRSFNEARDGEPASRSYDPRTGQVGAGNGEVGPAKQGGAASGIDDAELLAEIDAAVEAAEQAEGKIKVPPEAGGIGELVKRAQSPPAVPAPSPSPLSARRLAAMAAAASDRPVAPDERVEPEAEMQAERRIKPVHVLGAREPESVSSSQTTSAPADDETKTEATPLLGFTPTPSPRSVFQSRQVTGPATADEFAKLLSAPDAPVEVHLPGAVAAPPIKATEARFDVKADAARPGGFRLRAPGDGGFDARMDKGQASRAAIPDLSPPPFSVKMDKEEREAPKIVSPTEADFAVQRDQSSSDLAKASYEAPPPPPPVLATRPHKTPPTIPSPMDAPIGVKRDTPEKRTPPHIPTDIDMPVAVVRDREERAEAPRLRSPGDERAHARVDRDEKEPVKLRSPADMERFEAHVAKEQREPPRLRSPADSGHYAVKQDRETKTPPRLVSPADAGAYSVRMDREAKGSARLASPADSADFDLHAPGGGMRKVPRLQSAADAESFDVRMSSGQGKLPRLQSAADVDDFEAKMASQGRRDFSVINPGQADFEVRLGHESAWSTPLKRDVDHTKKKEPQ